MADGRWQIADGRWQMADGMSQLPTSICLFAIVFVIRDLSFFICCPSPSNPGSFLTT
jgi:hypothetical protein